MCITTASIDSLSAEVVPVPVTDHAPTVISALVSVPSTAVLPVKHFLDRWSFRITIIEPQQIRFVLVVPIVVWLRGMTGNSVATFFPSFPNRLKCMHDTQITLFASTFIRVTRFVSFARWQPLFQFLNNALGALIAKGMGFEQVRHRDVTLATGTHCFQCVDA